MNVRAIPKQPANSAEAAAEPAKPHHHDAFPVITLHTRASV